MRRDPCAPLSSASEDSAIQRLEATLSNAAAAAVAAAEEAADADAAAVTEALRSVRKFQSEGKLWRLCGPVLPPLLQQL